MIYELHKTRLHILNFAVHPDYRYNRVGMQMVNKLVSKLSHQRRTRILLEVRERNLPAQVFFPAPKVESAVVAMDRKPAPDEAERAIELARAGFGQRRKMLRRSLASLLPDPVAVLERSSVAPTSRAEELSPDDYLRLARVTP